MKQSLIHVGLDIDGVAPVEIRVLKSGLQTEKQSNESNVTISNRFCFWVQVGAFGDVNNADRAVEKLKTEGEKAVEIEGPEGLIRVRVGPFNNKKDRELSLKRLRDEWPNARVVECGE